MTTSTAPPAPAFGSLAWATANDGRLSGTERLREAARATRTMTPLIIGRLADRLSIPARRTASIDVDAIRFPDSKIAKDAEQECRESVSPMLFNHSVRTYVWGLMLAQRDGLRPDLELFYVASMLHDLTLGETHRHFAPIDCFAARGGLLAEKWTAARGWGPERCAIVADAISLHLNAKVGAGFGPEAQLLQAGAGVDTIGLRDRHLDRASVEEVVQRYPRCGLKTAGPLTFEDEGHPGTRASFLNKLGFSLLVRTSGFAE